LVVAAWRYAVAAAILLPFALRQRPADGLGRAAGPLALMVVCGGVLYPWLFLLALSRTSATNTALLIALNPVLTLLFSPLVGERLDRRRLLGVLVALAGAATVITRGDPAHLAALSLGSGDLVALAAAATWATFNLTSRRVVGHLTPAFTNCVIYALGAAALYVLGRGESPWAQLAAATPTAVAGVVVMAVLSSVIAGQCRLLHRLRPRRMRVPGAGHVLGAGGELDRERSLGDQVRGARAQDVEADDAIAPRVGEHLHAALGLAEAAGAAVGHEGEGPHPHLEPAARGVLLGEPDARQLGPGVDDARDGVVVHVAGEAGHQLDRGDAFLLGLVREHGPPDRVADRVHARHAGLEALVHRDAAAFVERDARLAGAEALHVRPAADRDQDDV